MTRSILVSTALISAWIAPILAQNLPYNPVFLVKGQKSKVYQFKAESPQLAAYDATDTIYADDAPEELTSDLPFLSTGENGYIPIATRDGITVFTGECSEGDQELNLWTYGFGADNGTWTQMKTTSSDSGLRANYLAAAFAFPDPQAQDEDSLYVFGGMCPNGSSEVSTWATNAAYSNVMLTISPEQGDDYEVSLTGQRSPPIAEAGLSITPLVPTTFQADQTPQQQNFVLIGGHTQNAFINMSQVAMFSMPEQAWAFIGIDQPTDAVVEPRSGHTAAMTEDGSKIVVFGGWVGDVANPARPQLAVLEVGQGYGGNGSWSWTIPTQTSSYFDNIDGGIYGHGAVMLSGDIMMVTGGRLMQTSNRKRQSYGNMMFYNVSSSTWTDSYTNPAITAAPKTKSGLTLTEKTGIGAGLGVGSTALVAVGIIWYLYARRKKQQRIQREKCLRRLALGTDQAVSTSELFRPASTNRGTFSAYRSPSWGARQEQSIEGDGNGSTRQTNDGFAEPRDDVTGSHDRLDIPGPTRGLRTNHRVRGPSATGPHAYPNPAAGTVFTIQEEEERSRSGSVHRLGTRDSRPLSDPFKDPSTPPAQDPDAERRREEVKTWVEDWTTAAETMTRSASKTNSKTYSNLSAYQSGNSGSSSDRTGSNLSEQSNVSNISIQKSVGGTVSRTTSQRSGSAGYALFSGAAAAMGRMAGLRHEPPSEIERTASKRSISTGDLSQLKSRKRSNSIEQSQQPTRIVTSHSREELNDYFTLPESPVKDYKNHARMRSNSLTHSGKKALGALGQATKRVLTGTGTVSVQDKVSTLEGKSRETSPTKPEMSEATRSISASGATFWQHRQGAQDWRDGLGESSGTIRRRSGRVLHDSDADDGAGEDDDWDVEAAVQQRVVQVMFTVPKEKLRVVNADNLSLMSRSDTNASRESKRSADGKEHVNDANRMSRVTEHEDEVDGIIAASSSLHPDSACLAKGKEKMVERTNSGGTIGKAL